METRNMKVYNFGTYDWYDHGEVIKWWSEGKWICLVPRFLQLKTNRFLWCYTNTPGTKTGVTLRGYAVIPHNPNDERKVA